MRRSALIPLTAAGAAFLAMFDATVVNLAIPDLAVDHPAAETADLTWVITLYAVCLAALLAPAGRLADLLGARTVFVAGTAVFTAASVGCALAPELAVLFAGRAVQGAGAAAMLPASLAILLRNTPPERRAGAIGLWGASSAIAAAVGPSGGGLLVEAWDWHALFLINLPLGLLLILGVLAASPADARGKGRWPDFTGTALLGVGVGGLVLGLTLGQEWGWGSARTAAVLAVGVASTGLALWRSSRHPVPAIETGLWRNPWYAWTNLATFLYGTALFPWLFVGILYLTDVWGYTGLEAGLAQSPGAVTASVTALLSGRFISRYGPRPAIIGGALIMVATVVWIRLALTPEPEFLAFWLPSGLFVGIGMGALATGVASSAALAVAPERFAGAVGLNTAARQIGGALGVAAIAVILPAGTSAAHGDYLNVYLFCGAAAFATAVAGAALYALRPAPAPSVSPA
ncbi:EmrB/QacA subfamily drug resistance transporter [Actinocorallia herbida]|uniref:EmrB/QacA subfamily drug resistance transporter n=1 Tax=Actinocorallia herbida TaxID=58109 RepID=A0A3N1DBB5_9ACTN|nr:MFS transporter [Actinocorallia herbida]ROO90821.1 EmrB/QacA subfamily drug resistance transporter [Actinocorallia herbida]